MPYNRQEKNEVRPSWGAAQQGTAQSRSARCSQALSIHVSSVPRIHILEAGAGDPSIEEADKQIPGDPVLAGELHQPQ